MYNTDKAADGHHEVPPQLIGIVVRKLRGEPNRRLSTKNDLRYGTNGSLSVNVKDGVWFSHEDGSGGGILDLIERETGVTGSARRAKLEELTGYRCEANGKAKTKAPLAPIVATYDYPDAEGIPRLRVTRHEGKRFCQWHGNGRDWRPGAPVKSAASPPALPIARGSRGRRHGAAGIRR